MAVLKMRGEEIKTFPRILRDYADHLFAVKGISPNTVCEYLSDLRTFFRYIINENSKSPLPLDEFETISISEIDDEDVKRVRTGDIMRFLVFVGQDKKNSTTTRQRKLSSLRSFFQYAVNRLHIIEVSPVANVDSPKKGKTLPKYLTVEESVRLLEAVKSDSYSKTTVRDFAIVTLFLNTGMRLSELVGLNLTSFKPDLSSVTVVGKGNKERVIYLNDAARRAVAEYLRQRLDPRYILTSDKAFFLSKRQQRISNKTVQWMVGKYLDLSGLGARGLSVHKLRHTAATLMYQSGKVDIRVLKDILGHEQLNTTQIYTHVVSRNLQEAMANNPLADVKIKAPVTEDDEL